METSLPQSDIMGPTGNLRKRLDEEIGVIISGEDALKTT